MRNLLNTKERELTELKLAYHFNRINSREYMTILNVLQQGWDKVAPGEVNHIASIMKKVKLRNTLRG